MPLSRSGTTTNDELSPRRSAGKVLGIKIPAGSLGSSRPAGKKSEGPLNRISNLFKKEKGQTQNEFARYIYLVRKMPNNPKAHLKLAEIYEKKGETQKAISEYLHTTEILCQKGLYPQAITLFKQILRQDPTSDRVMLKMAEIYRKMGSIAEAYSQYGRLLRFYTEQGKENEALEVMVQMAELSMQKIDKDTKAPDFPPSSKAEETGNGNGSPAEIPRSQMKGAFFNLNAELQGGGPGIAKGSKEMETEKIYGFEEILKELKRMKVSTAAYPQFNFHMGVACREMGFINEAIDQFQSAFEKGQNPFEAAHLLGHCFREKGCWDEARRSFAQALKVEGISPEKIQEIKDDLILIDREEKKEKDEANGISVEAPGKRELALLYRSPRKMGHAG